MVSISPVLFSDGISVISCVRISFEFFHISSIAVLCTIRSIHGLKALSFFSVYRLLYARYTDSAVTSSASDSFLTIDSAKAYIACSYSLILSQNSSLLVTGCCPFRSVCGSEPPAICPIHSNILRKDVFRLRFFRRKDFRLRHQK